MDGNCRAILRRHELSGVPGAGLFSRAILPSDEVLKPWRLIPLGGNARRLQRPRPVARLRVIKDVSTALRQDREKNIALSSVKKELTVHRCVDVHQLDRASELFVAFPDALDLNEPGVVICLGRPCR
jgi:hypothetical protein